MTIWTAALTGATLIILAACNMLPKSQSAQDRYEGLVALAKKGSPIGPVLRYLDKSAIPHTNITKDKRIVLVIHNIARGPIVSESISVEIDYDEQDIIASVTSKKQYTGP